MTNVGTRAVVVRVRSLRQSRSFYLQDHAVVDSGSLAIWTGTKAIFQTMEDFNGDFVAFGSDPTSMLIRLWDLFLSSVSCGFICKSFESSMTEVVLGSLFGRILCVLNWALKPKQPEGPPFTYHMLAICRTDVPVFPKAPKTSSHSKKKVP
ncbi:hypothetical protein Tco_0137690 [Tanacetum coccineum]